jgi:hypothetical protein
MDHFWSTCNAECEGALLVRYYVDGEEKASIEFEPGMAAGTGFDDIAAPWGESGCVLERLRVQRVCACVYICLSL